MTVMLGGVTVILRVVGSRLKSEVKAAGSIRLVAQLEICGRGRAPGNNAKCVLATSNRFSVRTCADGWARSGLHNTNSPAPVECFL